MPKPPPGNSFYSNEVETYDAASSEWVPAPAFLMARGYPGVVAIGSSIYIVGGQGIGNSYTTTVEEYRPE